MQNQPNQDYNESLKIELDKLPIESQHQITSNQIFHPNNPPWNSWIALASWVGSIFLIAIVPLIFILIYLASQKVNLTDAKVLQETLQTDPNAILFNLIGIIPAHLLTILMAWLIVTWGRRYSFTEMIGWKSGGFNLLSLIGIVIGFFVVAGILGHFFPEQDNDLLKILRSSRTAVFIVAFMATFTAPFVEEVIYRGIMYSAFQRTFGIPMAVIFVTLLFALVHVPQYYPSYSTIFMICLLSLVLTLVRVKSNNLLPCVILHTIFNGIQSALLIAEPYLKQFMPDEKAQPAIFFWLN